MSKNHATSRGNLTAVPDVDEAQLTIDDAVPAMTSLTADFLAFHEANPHVYIALRRLAREWLAEGKSKCSITLLYNVARWRLSLNTTGPGMFELNDHHQSFYARALMHFEPDLAGMFNLRRADEADAWIRGYQQAALRTAQRAA